MGFSIFCNSQNWDSTFFTDFHQWGLDGGLKTISKEIGTTFDADTSSSIKEKLDKLVKF
jgi:hypothetical protein